jgi:hypothetical protein
MKNKKILFVVLAVLLWVALFVFSTKIILFITGNTLKGEQIDTTTLSPDVKYHIDRISSPEGIMKKVTIEGWAFNVNYRDGSERNVSIILKGPEFSFEIPAKTYDSNGIANHFKDLNISPEDLKFDTSFSVLAIPNGKYEIFVKVWETGEAFSMVQHYENYVKLGNEFSVVGD